MRALRSWAAISGWVCFSGKLCAVLPWEKRYHECSADYARVERLSSVSSGVVSGGDYRAFRAGRGMRAAVNAWLEEISFRAGVTAAAIFVPVLAAVTVTVVLVTGPSHGSPVASMEHSRAAVGSPVTAASASLPAPPTHASGQPRPEVSTSPVQAAVQSPVAADRVSQPAAAGSPARQEAWYPTSPPSAAPRNGPFGRGGAGHGDSPAWHGIRGGHQPAGLGRARGRGAFRG